MKCEEKKCRVRKYLYKISKKLSDKEAEYEKINNWIRISV